MIAPKIEVLAPNPVLTSTCMEITAETADTIALNKKVAGSIVLTWVMPVFVFRSICDTSSVVVMGI